MSTFDKAKDKAQQVGGEAKQRLGEATDNEDMEAEGKRDKLGGEMKEAGHDLRDKGAAAVHDAKEALKDDK
ncbi:CsbD family protein [Kibdelosporangium persicum]|uniref:Mismatched base pair and cruciform DNArecognition protein n=1 Tax=Kibdelosporangium persicum TaxID=2698649 RepID=A0ABX2F2Q6_9PSEU|nr:CsbD family protein [Kibdelosporangium persicum]NRN65158.1 Mismatched base pair and cruciform DNArecognition protein [Kibdelosporangium persicum]